MVVSIIFRWPFGANSSQGRHPLGQDNIITLLFFIFPAFADKDKDKYKDNHKDKDAPNGATLYTKALL